MEHYTIHTKILQHKPSADKHFAIYIKTINTTHYTVNSKTLNHKAKHPKPYTSKIIHRKTLKHQT